ncbi:mechanosensitive ion channel family protein [Caldimonas tepidiphila]|uniref:mechanosensitive ion channel family protein n=1 Tax=Caldimonas tepidiphila TaxID=2315841 RepID=UPI0013004029|nr:mechanosensitive ion channel family protein [Caldimonas tepidiphila]
MDLHSLVSLPASLENELERVFLTLVLVLAATGTNLLLQRQIQKRGESLPQRRVWSAWAKNLCWTVGATLVFSLWASKLASFALSVAAIAAAILVVSKELVGCLLGAVYLTLTRHINIGDFIEVGDGGLRGQVVGINPFTVVIAQSGEANQITGRLTAVPNATFLTTPVRNLSATGRFSMFLVRVQVPRVEEVLEHSRQLLEAAEAECASWIEEASRQFEAVELSEHVDLPSARPRVLYELNDAKSASLVLRFTCEPNLRVRTEQAILRRYLERIYAPLPMHAAAPEPVEAAPRVHC